MATDAEASAGTSESAYVNPKQLKEVAVTSFYANVAQLQSPNDAETITVSHALWVTPKFVKIVAWYYDNSATPESRNKSIWSYDGTRNVCIYGETEEHWYWYTSTTACLRIDDGLGDYVEWTVTTMNSTDIVITIAETGTFLTTSDDYIRVYVEFYA